MPRKKTVSKRLDVRSHFGLHAIPMTREIAVRDRWKHEIYEEALADLQATVVQRMSAAIIGPSGAGKSGVLRSLTDALPEARYRIHYVKVTDLSKRDFCREIAAALGCSPPSPMLTIWLATEPSLSTSKRRHTTSLPPTQLPLHTAS